MPDAFTKNAIEGNPVSGWHDTWQAAAIRVRTAAAARGDFARIPEIGRAAMATVPAEHLGKAMDTLYEAYWNNRLDWDIRRLLEDEDDLGPVGTGPMYEAIDQARTTGQRAVTVDRDQLAALLERFDTLRLHLRHCPERDTG